MEPSTHPLASPTLLGGLIAAGIALGGMFIGYGFMAARMERYVTVRGLVERPVRADVAVWTISYSATSDDVVKANAEIDRATKLALAFAKKQGFAAPDLAQLPTRVTDQTRWGGDGAARQAGRYRVDGGIRVRSADVERVQSASRLTGELIAEGVVLSFESDGGSANPAYFFTKLDQIRPSMLADATKSARAGAQQFAQDSGSGLGAIRRANQGVFQILPRDAVDSQNTFDEPRTIEKKVRLVSTIDYYLDD